MNDQSLMHVRISQLSIQIRLCSQWRIIRRCIKWPLMVGVCTGPKFYGSMGEHRSWASLILTCNGRGFTSKPKSKFSYYLLVYLLMNKMTSHITLPNWDQWTKSSISFIHPRRSIKFNLMGPRLIRFHLH